MVSLHGTKRKYYAKSPEEMREPRKVGNSGYFVETHWSAKSMKELSLRLLALFGYSEEDLRMEAH